MFDLVFLGTSAAVPSAERGSPALYVGHGPERFLVDCGEGTQRQLMRARLGFRGLQHVLLTHAHLDHIAGLAGLVATRALYSIEQPINIIGSAETVRYVGYYLALTVGPERDAGYRLRAIEPGPVQSWSGWRTRDIFRPASWDAKSWLPLRGGNAGSACCRAARGARRTRRAPTGSVSRRSASHTCRWPDRHAGNGRR